MVASGSFHDGKGGSVREANGALLVRDSIIGPPGLLLLVQMWYFPNEDICI
jgi:hypothetical protein